MTKEMATITVMSGDMIYADGLCSETGLYGNKQVVGDFNLSATLKDFRAHWAYNRKDRRYREYLAGSQALIAWDDHEIVNVRHAELCLFSVATFFVNRSSNICNPLVIHTSECRTVARHPPERRCR